MSKRLVNLLTSVLVLRVGAELFFRLVVCAEVCGQVGKKLINLLVAFFWQFRMCVELNVKFQFIHNETDYINIKQVSRRIKS